MTPHECSNCKQEGIIEILVEKMKIVDNLSTMTAEVKTLVEVITKQKEKQEVILEKQQEALVQISENLKYLTQEQIKIKNDQETLKTEIQKVDNKDNLSILEMAKKYWFQVIFFLYLIIQYIAKKV